MISPDDLSAMHAIASRAWREQGPYVEHHAGDLAWGARDASALLLGDGYAYDDGGEWHLGGPGAALPALVAAARDRGVAVWSLATESAKVATLRAAGYLETGHGFHHFVHDLSGLPPWPARVTYGADAPDARVALHRAAWHPSRFTREAYDVVRATPPYREDLDVVVDGKAYALAWYDAGSASGELEPVGTDPAYRRQGYGAAACVAALHRLRAAGARVAVVYAIEDPGNPGPRALYESVGFRAVDRHVRWVAGQNAADEEGHTP